MKKIISKLMGGVLLFSLSMSLTSCEGALDDILGEWSRPTPGSSTGGGTTTIAVTSVTLDANEMKLAAGDKGQLTATVAPDNATDKTVTWSSDKEEIATVDANGLVTAVAMGTAIITAKAGDKTATCKVTVTPGLSTPLTIEAITAGTITVDNQQSGMKYSKNGATKTNVGIASISVAAGDKVAFYGNGTTITSYYSTYIGGDGDGFKCKVYGNIMSLVDETGFAKNTTLTATKTFQALFVNNAKLTDASGLLLPAMTLTDDCYNSMFQGCTSLTAAPAELPAKTLANSCYSNMFKGCEALTETPKLPATELKANCYQYMFKGCACLTTAYVKAAYKNSIDECGGMFTGCTNVTGSTFYSKDAATADTWRSTFSLTNWTSGVYPTE